MPDLSLSSWDVAHPSDRKIESRRLILDPRARFIERRAEFLRRCPARETSVCARHGALTDKGADEFVSAAWLDPGEKIAVGFHEGDILKDQFRGSGIDHPRSCLGGAPRLMRCEADD
jgi:hypothetical protein